MITPDTTNISQTSATLPHTLPRKVDTAKEDLSIVAAKETSCFDKKVDLSLNDSPEVVIKNVEGAMEDTIM